MPGKTTLEFTPEQHKKIKKYCIDNDLTMKEFITHSVTYCMRHNINPPEKPFKATESDSKRSRRG